jgi:hypothetical protein
MPRCSMSATPTSLCGKIAHVYKQRARPANCSSKPSTPNRRNINSGRRRSTQRDLIGAQGAELRALADLVEAKANYERAVGRTLEVNRVTIADAKHGAIEHETLIPGTLNGQVVGTDKIFANSGQR